jgi:hypothetical protein
MIDQEPCEGGNVGNLFIVHDVPFDNGGEPKGSASESFLASVWKFRIRLPKEAF